MEQLKTLLVENLQDMLDAERQLTQALPKLADAAQHPSLKEAFQKHLMQTEGQVERLRLAFQFLRQEPETTPCKAMQGLIQEGEEAMEEGAERDGMAADLALIAAAQKVEHYEISAYGTAHCLARQLGMNEVAKLLSQSLGEEESSDFLLTTIAKPILQELALTDVGAEVDLATVGGPANESKGRSRKSAK